ncbi:hypothetical protein QR98_0058040 [Sarcoptes scabiei]|uniref:Uncharacterized protein n=1 Tax=Sarcoptes scabiei TaxID=52283 RepID=A0A132A8M8_SARSC|nr:hypothetical protein QR98_0058040 [Sarcoptes scabiei]
MKIFSIKLTLIVIVLLIAISVKAQSNEETTTETTNEESDKTTENIEKENSKREDSSDESNYSSDEKNNDEKTDDKSDEKSDSKSSNDPKIFIIHHHYRDDTGSEYPRKFSNHQNSDDEEDGDLPPELKDPNYPFSDRSDGSKNMADDETGEDEQRFDPGNDSNGNYGKSDPTKSKSSKANKPVTKVHHQYHYRPRIQSYQSPMPPMPQMPMMEPSQSDLTFYRPPPITRTYVWIPQSKGMGSPYGTQFSAQSLPGPYSSTPNFNRSPLFEQRHQPSMMYMSSSPSMYHTMPMHRRMAPIPMYYNQMTNHMVARSADSDLDRDEIDNDQATSENRTADSEDNNTTESDEKISTSVDKSDEMEYH